MGAEDKESPGATLEDWPWAGTLVTPLTCLGHMIATFRDRIGIHFRAARNEADNFNREVVSVTGYISDLAIHKGKQNSA